MPIPVPVKRMVEICVDTSRDYNDANDGVEWAEYDEDTGVLVLTFRRDNYIDFSDIPEEDFETTSHQFVHRDRVQAVLEKNYHPTLVSSMMALLFPEPVSQ